MKGDTLPLNCLFLLDSFGKDRSTLGNQALRSLP